MIPERTSTSPACRARWIFSSRTVVPLDETLPDGTVTHGPGSYVPVSLHWPPSASEFAQARWTTDVIERVGNRVHVRVGNRGREAAVGVSVRLWEHDYVDGDDPPAWNAGRGGWTEINGVPSGDTKTIQPGQSERFDFELPDGSHVLLFAEATCYADRANSDPSTFLPCSRELTPIIDLVSGDNNLGLAVFPAP